MIPFLSIFFTTALDAYCFFGVPVVHLSLLLFMFYYVSNKSEDRTFDLERADKALAFTALYCVLIIIIKDFAHLIDPGYYLGQKKNTFIIATRLTIFVSFTLLCWSVYALGRKYGNEKIISGIINVGVIIAAISIYIYWAQVLGWWEPYRSRLGTDGQPQTIEFAYAFHRAIGTFREPSMLAQWLVMPLLLSLWRTGTVARVKSIGIALAFFLTVSFTGMIGMGLGFIAALALYLIMNKGVLNKILIIKMVSATALLAATFTFTQFSIQYRTLYTGVSYKEFGSGNILGNFVVNRVTEYATGGIPKTNRKYVYDFAAKEPVTLTGHGILESHRKLGIFIESKAVVSFLNLYLNTLFSFGVIGIVSLLYLLIRPLTNKSIFKSEDGFAVVATYLCWCSIFLVGAEELQPSFAIIYAVLINCTTISKQSELP